MKWHCYLVVNDHFVDSADVDAEGSNEAAVIAATRTDETGTWTVVPGEPVEVEVKERSAYYVETQPPFRKSPTARRTSGKE